MAARHVRARATMHMRRRGIGICNDASGRRAHRDCTVRRRRRHRRPARLESQLANPFTMQRCPSTCAVVPRPAVLRGRSRSRAPRVARRPTRRVRARRRRLGLGRLRPRRGPRLGRPARRTKLDGGGLSRTASSTRRSPATRRPAAARALPALLKQHKPAIVVIELGGNDALRGGNLAATRDNLDAMVAAAQARRREGADRRHAAAAELRARVRARSSTRCSATSRRRARRALVPYRLRGLRRRPRACSSPTASIRPPRRSRGCSTTSGRR